MRVTSHQEDKQTYESCRWVGEKKENLKRQKVFEVSKLTYRIEKSLFQTAKGKSARHPKKHNEHNQKLIKIAVGELV